MPKHNAIWDDGKARLIIDPTAAPEAADFQGGLSLDAKPATPHADDDEFDATTLSTSWSKHFTTVVDPPKRGAGFLVSSTPASMRTSLTQRRGWLLMQAESSQGDAAISKVLSSAFTGGLIYTKVSIDGDNSIQQNYFAFGICQTLSGGIDGFNLMQVALNKDGADNSWLLTATAIEAGTTAVYTDSLDSFLTPICRMAIGIDGNDIHFFAGGEQGNFKHLGYYTKSTFTPARIFFNNWNGQGVPPVNGIDYVRRLDGAFPTV